MKRRSFLASILAAGVAPAAVGSDILMPVRKPVAPPLGPLPLSVIDQIASRLHRTGVVRMEEIQHRYNAQMLQQLTNLVVLGISAVDGQGRDVTRQLWFDGNGDPHIEPRPLIVPAGTRIERIVVNAMSTGGVVKAEVEVGRDPWRA